MTQQYRLGRNERIRLDGGTTGIAISCREGALWITQTGTPGDHLLRAGDGFSSDRPGRIVIGALEDSVCTVATPEADPSRLPLFLVQAVLRLAHRFAGAGNLWA